jgi:hypothetical protein
MLRVLIHWQSDGTSVLMLVEDLSRNKCFFQDQISHVLRFISICDLFTDSPSHEKRKQQKCIFTVQRMKMNEAVRGDYFLMWTKAESHIIREWPLVRLT